MLFLLSLERRELALGERPPQDPREDIFVLQAVDRLEEGVVERLAEPRAERPPRAEVEREIVDERAVQVEDRGGEGTRQPATPDGGTRP